MKAVVFCVVLLAAVASVRADDEGKVLVLDEDSFDTEIGKHSMTLVEFYAPWCGHCKRLAPEYVKASLALDGKNAGALAKVDCTVEKDLCSKYGVRGFPTLKLFRADGAAPVDYDGGRSSDDIVKYMVKQNQPAVTELNSVDDVKNFSPSDSVKIVAFVNSDTNLDAFTNVAKALRNDYSFGVVKGNADANANWKVSAPGVVVLRDFDEGAVNFPGPFTAASFEADLTAFIKGQSFPLVGEIGPHNYQKYVERGYNFVWVFINPDSEEHKTLIAESVTPVAAQFRNQLSFVKLDGVRWAEHAKSFGLSGSTPAIVLEDRQKRKNFILDESKPITKDSLQAHVEGVLAGTVQPNLKSEEIPADNSGPVKVIVGKTFESIVNDESKDVFVEFYAPWCGHCKSLAPKYEELGKMFENDPTTIIAKVDATANDTPADVTGFPTLIFYPAGNKADGVKYNGAREAKDMADFVRANKGVKAASGSAAATGHEDL